MNHPVSVSLQHMSLLCTGRPHLRMLNVTRVFEGVQRPDSDPESSKGESKAGHKITVGLKHSVPASVDMHASWGKFSPSAQDLSIPAVKSIVQRISNLWSFVHSSRLTEKFAWMATVKGIQQAAGEPASGGAPRRGRAPPCRKTGDSRRTCLRFLCDRRSSIYGRRDYCAQPGGPDAPTFQSALLKSATTRFIPSSTHIPNASRVFVGQRRSARRAYGGQGNNERSLKGEKTSYSSGEHA